MTTAVAFTKADLDQVFDEVNNAQKDVDDKTDALQHAERKAAEVKGLTAAAQRALRDAEASLQLLTLARDEAESNNAEYASLSPQLDAVNAELKQANDRRAKVDHAKRVISDFKIALRRWVNETQGAITNTFDSSATQVEGLTITEDAQKSTVASSLRNQSNILNRRLGELWGPQEGQLDYASQQLEESAPSAARITELVSEQASLVSQRNRVMPKPDKAPGADAIQQAQDGVETARTAAEEAPEVERDRHAKLRLARENLTAAKDRLTAAQVAKGAAERTWIEGIDFIGPGADGFVTPSAKLSTALPPGYSLEWTFDGAPLLPDMQGRTGFNTKDLATGSYAVAVHLTKG
jgi:chromosome segregation ATPase